MKLDIDLKDPRVIALTKIMHDRAEFLLNASLRIEDAVLPVYSPQKDRLKQTGSCVAFRIESEYFLLSASHVFDDIGEFRLAIGTPQL